jgi:membrane associated rhomboid family serine protease
MNEPLVTVFLILATASVSLWALDKPHVEQRFIFRPENVLAGKEYYRLVSSAFLHAGWAHLLLNMYTLYYFGGAIERLFGPGQFLVIYFGSVIGGSLLSLYIHRHHDYAAYGASGGVCGLIFAYVLRFPESRMAIFPLPYAVPGWIYALAFVIASFYAMKAARDNIGHDAHLGGSLIGLMIAAILRPGLVREHWGVFACLCLAGGGVFAYLLINPLFLPLSSFAGTPIARKPPPPRPRTSARRVPPRSSTRPAAKSEVPTPDWLISEIEIQVGKLDKDSTGACDWIDRFGRTYKIAAGRADSFDFQVFTSGVMNDLRDPSVNFVIVGTRALAPNQVDLLRPFFAELPDTEFNRVLRSFAFRQKR